VYFLKLYRKLFPQTNPEVELVAFITQHSEFRNIPAFAGSVVWEVRPDAPDTVQTATGPAPTVTLGMMQRMVPNKKDNWALTGDYLNQFLYAVPNRMFAVSEDVFEQVALLGRRTAELHAALYRPRIDPATPDQAAFAPEPFDDTYRQFLIHRFTDLLDRRYALLIDSYAALDPLAQRLAWVFMEAKELIEAFVADFARRPLGSLRIRVHGDYHLGQVLAVDSSAQAGGQPAGTDFVIIDFEGEPESTIAERKIKHSPLKDVAGMIRSYHYAVSAKLFNADETGNLSPEHLQRVADRWFKLIRDTYLDAYLAELGTPHPLFRDNTEINFLLLVYLLEKAVYELGYELSYRPDWVKIPLRGILDVIQEIEKIHLANPDRPADLPRLQSALLKADANPLKTL
jgi:maltose alpha-D-glucosyltransferase / alpha-amylase